MTIKVLTKLIQELDFYKYVDFNHDKVTEIEAKLEKMRDSYKQVKSTSTYVPYPDISSDPDFYEKIYHKKEFYNTKAQPISKNANFDELASEKCSQTNFKLTQNQIFLKNFISPTTPYNGILLFHGVGVGKCFIKDTPILMANGFIKRVQNVKIGDKVMGDDSSARNVISIAESKTDEMYEVTQKFGTSYTVNGSHILSLKYYGNDIDISVDTYMECSKLQKSKMFSRKAKLVFFTKIIEEVLPPFLPYQYGFHNMKLPNTYRLGYPWERCEYIAGLIDSKGVVVDQLLEIPFSLEIDFILNSLGIGTLFTKNRKLLLYGKNLRFIKTKILAIPDFIKKYDTYSNTISVQRTNRNIYYGFGVDGNHRFLLGDCTITHNSCSSISIAEQFQDVFEKPVLVLMPTNLKDNFRRQIFDSNKKDQCTGIKYKQMISHDPLTSDEIIRKRINRIISDRYTFSGFQEFANQIIKAKDRMKKEKFASYIYEKFSNRVIIIDEVHNVREGDGDKIVTPVLLNVLQTARNVKLVLLSATPMFNTAHEIVWLMNLLLANDHRPLLLNNDIFEPSGKISSAGKLRLQEACKGYISYMKGENPFSFPMRLYPSINNDSNVQTIVPKYDIRGEPIPQSEQLKNIELIESRLSSAQKALLNRQVADLNDNENNLNLISMVQISNVVYPNELHGAVGLKNTFNIKKTLYSYKPNTIEVFAPTNLIDYSPKIARIIDYVKNSKGIVFIYSFYIDSGIIPLALALEHIGYSKFTGNNLLDKQVPRNGLKYSIISANKDLTPDFDKEIDAARSEANINGDIIKVIIGSSVAAEGIDFKCIREVHLMEPWYHLNKAEQIIGRAIRNCSHSLLPSEERNTTIYHHICTNQKSDKRRETIDERIYRIAENKQKTIDDVEDILKNSAIDCMFNKNNFNIETDITLTVKTSQGKTIKNVPIKSKKNNIQCSPIKKQQEIDISTFNKSFYGAEIEELSKKIAKLFLDKHFFTFDDIIDKLGKGACELDVLMYTLQNMIDTKYPIKQNESNIEGYVIYRSNIYMYQPKGTTDTFMPLKSRQNYKPIKQTKLHIVDLVPDDSNEPVNAPFILDESINEIKNSLKLDNSKISTQVLYDFVIDRLDFKVQVELVKNVIKESYIYNSLKSSHVLIELVDKVWIRNIHVNPCTYHYLENDTLKLVSMRELNNANIAELKMDRSTKLKGYLDIASKFKLLDIEKANSNGFVCSQTSTLKIDELRKNIHALIPNLNLELKKPKLCELYELVLRHEKDSFARPYQSQIIFSKK